MINPTKQEIQRMMLLNAFKKTGEDIERDNESVEAFVIIGSMALALIGFVLCVFIFGFGG